MNKKGGHVDWVISMGIFITYIFALFILLRPGIKPIYRPETLLDNLQDRFEDDVTWVVKKVPLFVRKCGGGSAEKGYSTVTIDDEANSWRCSIIKDDLDNIYPDPLECGNPEKVEDKSVPFYFYFYKTGDSAPRFKVDPTCIFPSGAEETDYCLFDLGIAEDIEGINKILLSEITSTDIEVYKNLKESWDFPMNKEFAIMEDGDKLIGAEPYVEANVFVRGIKTQTVTREGIKNSVTIYFKIW